VPFRPQLEHHKAEALLEIPSKNAQLTPRRYFDPLGPEGRAAALEAHLAATARRRSDDGDSTDATASPPLSAGGSFEAPPPAVPVATAAPAVECSFPCAAHATCNEREHRCDCPPGLGGSDCATLAVPSCLLEAPGSDNATALEAPPVESRSCACIREWLALLQTQQPAATWSGELSLHEAACFEAPPGTPVLRVWEDAAAAVNSSQMLVTPRRERARSPLQVRFVPVSEADAGAWQHNELDAPTPLDACPQRCSLHGACEQRMNGLLRNPVSIQVTPRNTTVQRITQTIHPVGRAKKKALLTHIISEHNWSQVLVFTRTKFGANNVAEHLTKNGIPAMALHGNKSQTARTQALAGFKNGDIRALVATDIAARGIDIDELPHVVNYEIPNVSEDYVHRIGRTGRAGNSGEAVSLVCLDEEGFMQDIERFTKQNIEVVVVPGFEADPGERAEPLAMGRQTIWGGLGKPPSREVMQAAAKAARSEMMTRIRENKPQTGRGPGAGNGGGGGGNAGRGRSAGAGNGGGNGGGGGGGRGPRQNTGYSQGGQGGQPAQARNPNAQPPRQQQARPQYDDDAQPTSHVSSGFPSSGQPTGGNRGGFRGGRPAGGGGGGGGGGPRSGGGGGRGNGYGRSGGSGSFNGR
jgi:hypothetical protein